MTKKIDVRKHQNPLIKLYKQSPEKAFVTDHAKTISSGIDDPFHGEVKPGKEDHNIVWKFGVHQGVGGPHDFPVPGDILSAALATCLDSTIRLIANRLDLDLKVLEVEVSANVDLRGTLAVDREVPVGFQSMKCNITIEGKDGTDPQQIKKLIKAAEYSCVVLQTLQSGVPVETSINGNLLQKASQR